MGRRARILLAIAGPALLAVAGPLARPIGAVPAPGDEPGSARELLVGFAPGSTAGDRAAARNQAAAELKERVVRDQPGRGEVELVAIPEGADRDDAVGRLRAHPSVRFAEPNFVYTHSATSDDPFYTEGSLWGMYGDLTTPANQFGSQAGEAWAAGNVGSASVYVGVIDEGIQLTHPDLAGNAWTNPFDPVNGLDDDGNGYIDDSNGWDFANNDRNVYDGGSGGNRDRHGTHVAGTLGAVGGNGSGVAGMNWDVTIISAKFLNPSGGTTANAVKALDYLTDLKVRHGLNIVATNNSWGGGGFSTALSDAIERANAQGILFVAAAGNGGFDGIGDNNDIIPNYPSSYANANVISVAAITSSGARSSFSNFGATSVDLGAPGSGIISTLPSNGYGTLSGTSMATPHVTGAAALYAAAHPGSSAAAIKAAILGSAQPTASLAGITATGGRLDVSSFGGAPPAPTVPSAPTGLAATGGDGSVGLSWSPPASDGGSPVTAYSVYRGTTPGAAVLLATVGATTAYTDASVSNGTTYYYQVSAANAVGPGPRSGEISATPTASSISLSAVGSLRRGFHLVDLTWAGAAGAQVDIVRDGVVVATTANDGSHRDPVGGTGSASYAYQVCQTAGGACSAVVVVTFA